MSDTTRSPRNAAPTVRTRNTLRTDTRSLLRSRPLQAALVAVAGVQVAAVAAGKAPHSAEPATITEAVVANLTPVVVAAPVKQVGEIAASASDRLAPADRLAEKYRSHGFSVSPKLARQIHQAAVESGIDPRVAFGLVKTESGFKNSATSHVGAIGLTQLMPSTARWLERGTTTRALRDPEVNLRIGFRYLNSLIEKYDGNTRLALLAYNRGPGTVDRVLRRGGNPDNGYASMVLGFSRRR